MTQTEFDSELFGKGIAMRRKVLGDEYVDRSLARGNDLTAPLQRMVTEWCWGEVWGRPGLDLRTRSAVNLAMLSALNRPNEVRLHVAGGLRNGLTRTEIQEIFLQVAVYCGVPAALEGMKAVVEVFEQMEADGAEARP